MEPADWLAFLHELADQADAIASRWFRNASLPVGEKGDRTPVTAADLEIERLLRDATRARYPQLGLAGEEFGVDRARATRLIVDPIDGTANFARGIPLFATLLAIEHQGELVAAAVSAPALGTRWSAARGNGAFRDGTRIRVSAIGSIERAHVFHAGLGGVEGLARLPGLSELLLRSARQRGFGDFYQHVLVAEGAGELAIDVGLAVWDIAAPALIVREAGGRATTLDGRTDLDGGSLISSNALLHDQALALLRATQ